jgi:putative addiction module killer protein
MIQADLDDLGHSPIGRWFAGLAAPSSLKITTALTRLEGGNTGALKPVRQGVHGLRIDFGPGYRVDLGHDAADLVILVGGSTKARQSAAIADSHTHWKDYWARKRLGG